MSIPMSKARPSVELVVDEQVLTAQIDLLPMKAAETVESGVQVSSEDIALEQPINIFLEPIQFPLAPQISAKFGGDSPETMSMDSVLIESPPPQGAHKLKSDDIEMQMDE